MKLQRRANMIILRYYCIVSDKTILMFMGTPPAGLLAKQVTRVKARLQVK